MRRTALSHWQHWIVRALAGGLAFSLTLASAPLAQAGSSILPGPALAVDAAAGVHAISPDIYGMNRADPALLAELHIPVNRWGGNDTTRYNYQNDITNHASDWYFENILNGDGSNLPDNSTANQFIAANDAAGSKTLLTVPTIGYVANNHEVHSNNGLACGFSVAKYGAQTSVDSYFPDCGNGVLSSGGNVAGNDPLDTSLAVDHTWAQGWIGYLQGKFGAANTSSGVKYYALDNEPDLWYQTQRDVHPAGAGYDELRDKAYEYGAAIKASDPNAKVFGPVSWGWWGYFYSALDVTTGGDQWWNTRPDRMNHGDIPFLEWYLQQMQAYETAHGTRILDYLDVHFYPQTGVDLRTAGDATLKAKRLRGTRSLWDPTYYESADGSWITDPVMLIPRMHSWVDNNYPGTKLAITEYNWGGLEDINGALAQADILGIFGRENLDLATIWDGPTASQPGAYAFRMYLNYDGSGGRFGDTSVQAASANQDQLAIYASTDSGSGAMKLMIINKTYTALSSTVSISNFSPASCAQSYTYSPANLSAIVRSWLGVGSGGFSAVFPGQSITLVVIPPASAGCSAPLSALAPPYLYAPRRGVWTALVQPRFAWSKIKGAALYNLQIDDNPDFSSPEIDVNTSRNSYIPPSALPYNIYYWRVQTVAADGLSAYSQPASFGLTILSAPKNGAILRTSYPTFAWKRVVGVGSYHLEVDEGAPGGTPAFAPLDLSVRTYRPSTPLAPGVYYWRVTASGMSPTPYWSFTTGA